MTRVFTQSVTLPQVFFKHFASKNQLSGLSVIVTLVENGLIVNIYSYVCCYMKRLSCKMYPVHKKYIKDEMPKLRCSNIYKKETH